MVTESYIARSARRADAASVFEYLIVAVDEADKSDRDTKMIPRDFAEGIEPRYAISVKYFEVTQSFEVLVLWDRKAHTKAPVRQQRSLLHDGRRKTLKCSLRCQRNSMHRKPVRNLS